MSKYSSKGMSSPSIKTLYPHLGDAQCQEAEENIEQYLQLALCIYERIRQEPELYAKFRHLTAKNHDHAMHGEPQGSL